jgi:hypothetical protein
VPTHFNWTLIPFLISHVRQVFLAAGAFTVTPNRKALVNFTMPISIQTTTFLTARPGEVSRALIFMAPFTYDVSNCIMPKSFKCLELSSSSESETSIYEFQRFTMHFDSLNFFTPTHALSHTTMY